MQKFLTIILLAVAASTAKGQHAAHQHAHPTPALDSASASQLAKQIDALRAAVTRYSDIEAARRDGYVRFGREERPLMGEHWFRRDLVHKPLDLTQPSTLQYATIDGKRTLVGVAFTVYQKPAEPAPEGFAGNSDHWHVHDITKMQAAIAENRPLAGMIMRQRTQRANPAIAAGKTNLVMVHAWTELDNPDGMFAEHHRALPYIQAGLPGSYAKGATVNAAWGIALIQRDGCDKELRAITALAPLTRTQQQRLSNACAIAEGKVLRSFRAKDPAVRLNAVANDAWTVYLAERDKTLTPQQKARLASVVEHPMGD